MNRIRKGDQVIVIAGADKGKKGEVVRVARRQGRGPEHQHHQAPHQAESRRPARPAAIIEREAPIHISNVMLFNPASGKGERVGFKVLEDGRKVRVFRSSGEALDA